MYIYGIFQEPNTFVVPFS